MRFQSVDNLRDTVDQVQRSLDQETNPVLAELKREVLVRVKARLQRELELVTV
jgi:hypothetical protein